MSPESAAAPKRHRGRTKILWCIAALFLGVCGFEALLRLVVYTDIGWGARWRNPKLYVDRWNDPFYFQLNQLLTGDPAPLPEKMADPRLGWIADGMDRQNFADPQEFDLGKRRPVLLFGASFIRCMTNSENCFEGWMQRSEFADDYRMLNYGVRGYGIDQTSMLVRLATPRWRSRKPVVVIGIFVEDDLDRTILDFRGWPKPRFTLDAEGKLVEPAPVPTPEEYSKAHPLWMHSLAWGWLVHQSGLVPGRLQRRLSGERANLAEKRKLSTALLDRIEYDLQAGGFEHFYVLFPSVEDCDLLEGKSWQEKFLLDWLDGRRLPFINVRRDLLEAALEQDRHPKTFFGLGDALPEHLTPDGNEVAFRGLMRGIQGLYDHTAGRRTIHPFELRDLDDAAQKRARIELGWSRRFTSEADRERLVMRPTAEARARFGCTFTARTRRFLTTAKLCGTSDSPLRLEILTDGKSVFDAVFDQAHPNETILLDVLDRASIEIIATRPDAARADGNFLVLARPRFE